MTSSDFDTPAFLFKGNDINALYKEITTAIVLHGVDFTFGKANKRARGIHSTIQLYGKAINDIEAGKVPRGFPFNGDSLKHYINNYNVKDLGFDYTYYELLKEGMNLPYDQFKSLRERLLDSWTVSRADNDVVGVLYNASMQDMESKPCWNFIQLRYLGMNKVSLIVLFRSHDYGTGLWANLCYVANLINKEVLFDTKMHISEILVTSTNAHIYKGDSGIAEKISGCKWNRSVVTQWLGGIYSKVMK